MHGFTDLDLEAYDDNPQGVLSGCLAKLINDQTIAASTEIVEGLTAGYLVQALSSATRALAELEAAETGVDTASNTMAQFMERQDG